MSIADKIAVMVENTQRAYDSGAASAESTDAFWESFQQNGTRIRYNYAFSYGWTDETFTPKYIVSPTEGYLSCMFEQSGITRVDTTKVDLSEVTSLPQTFRNAKSLTDVDISVLKVESMVQSFLGANNLKNLTIRKIGQQCTFNNTFNGCSSLENLVLEDCYIASNITFNDSPKLTYESLVENLIPSLENLSAVGMTATCAIGTTNLAKLTDAEKASATQKGWTLA